MAKDRQELEAEIVSETVTEAVNPPAKAEHELIGFRCTVDTEIKSRLDYMSEKSKQDIGLIVETAVRSFLELPLDEQKAKLSAVIIGRMIG